jgi:hypothetical protein
VRIRSIAVIAAVAVIACSDSSGPSSRHDGAWSGTTSQGHPIRVLVDGNRVRVIVVRAAITGTTCNRDLTHFFFRVEDGDAYPVTGDAFSAAREDSDVSISIEGTFDETSASGTVMAASADCDGEIDFTWTATKATAPAIDVSGNWDGTAGAAAIGEQVFSVTFTQSGSAVEGTYEIGAAASGTITGTLVDRLFEFKLRSTTPGCAGSYDGVGVFHHLAGSGSVPAVDLMAFSFSGSDCAGVLRGGGSATRAP